MCKYHFCNVRWCMANHSLSSCVCDVDHESAMKYHYYYYVTRGGWSHFFRLRIRSCSNIFESGSGSGNFSNLRICPLFRLATINDPTVICPSFYSRNDHTNSCYCRNWNVTPDPGPVFPYFWLRIRVRKKNAESCRNQLWHSGSGPNSGFYLFAECWVVLWAVFTIC